MLSTATCPCCSSPLLRHAQGGSVYWFCNHCHAKMPDLATVIRSQGSIRYGFVGSSALKQV